MSIKSLDSASHWIYQEFKNLNQEVLNAEKNYELAGAVDAIYNFLWNKYANWYVEYLKTDETDLAFGKELYQEFVILAAPYIPFEAQAIWRDIFKQDQDLSTMLADPSFLSKYQVDTEKVQEFEAVINLIEELRSIRGLFGIDPVLKMEIYLETETLASYEAYLSLVARARLAKSPESKEYLVHKQDFKFRLNILDFVLDKPGEIAKTEKNIAALEKQIASLQAQLQNKAFVDKAPEEVILDKQNFLQARILDLETQNNKLLILK